MSLALKAAAALRRWLFEILANLVLTAETAAVRPQLNQTVALTLHKRAEFALHENL
jgi:hypothetical protein